MSLVLVLGSSDIHSRSANPLHNCTAAVLEVHHNPRIQLYIRSTCKTFRAPPFTLLIVQYCSIYYIIIMQWLVQGPRQIGDLCRQESVLWPCASITTPCCNIVHCLILYTLPLPPSPYLHSIFHFFPPPFPTSLLPTLPPFLPPSISTEALTIIIYNNVSKLQYNMHSQ